MGGYSVDGGGKVGRGIASMVVTRWGEVWVVDGGGGEEGIMLEVGGVVDMVVVVEGMRDKGKEKKGESKKKKIKMYF